MLVETKILILRRQNDSLTVSTPSSRKENFKSLNLEMDSLAKKSDRT